MMFLIRLKVYLDRSRVYVGYIQLIFTILVTLKLFQDTAVGALLKSPLTLGVIVAGIFCVMLLIGYLDKRYIRPREISEMNSTNKELTEIHQILQKIDSRWEKDS